MANASVGMIGPCDTRLWPGQLRGDTVHARKTCTVQTHLRMLSFVDSPGGFAQYFC